MAEGRGPIDQILALDAAANMTSPRRLGDTGQVRWRIERDFQDLKQQIGLDHYEGRGWRGFHHHAALSIAAYGFLVAERSPIPPSGALSQALIAQAPAETKATVRAAAPLRPERHTSNSISTLGEGIAVALAKRLPRCPCCMQERSSEKRAYDTVRLGG